MGKERGAHYYDDQWTGQKWRKDWDKIGRPRTRLYTAAARLVPATADVIDLGCGGGHFGQCLQQLNPPATFHGLDFSEAGIMQARRRCDFNGYSFERADLTQAGYLWGMPQGAVYVCMEVLEHITEDLSIFSLIPEGARVVISVPTFDEPSHVRFFRDPQHIMRRYRRYLDFTGSTWKAIWKWHLFTAVRSSNEQDKTGQANQTLF